VTETAGHGADIRAGSDQLSGAEMTQVMKADIHSNPFGHAPESLAQTVRFERLGAVRLDAQYVSVGREDRANLAAISSTRFLWVMSTAKARGSRLRHRSEWVFVGQPPVDDDRAHA